MHTVDILDDNDLLDSLVARISHFNSQTARAISVGASKQWRDKRLEARVTNVRGVCLRIAGL